MANHVYDERNKGYIMRYRLNNKEKYNAYMRAYVNDRYYKQRYGMTKQDVLQDKILCDIHRLFKRSYTKKNSKE